MKIPTRKDYPKYIYVDETRYKIVFGNYAHRGRSLEKKQLLQLDKTLPPSTMFKTFLHELLHLIEYSYNLKIPHKLIYDLEQPLFQVLLDNVFIKQRKAGRPLKKKRVGDGVQDLLRSQDTPVHSPHRKANTRLVPKG